MKVVSKNKKVFHDYEIIDTLTAGISLQGTEVKSIRQNNANINEAYIRIKNNEAFIFNMFIDEYENGNIWNHEPTRIRKLLLNKKEILKWDLKQKQDDLTIIPIKINLSSNSLIKIEIALCKGLKKYDKREVLKKRDIEKKLKKYY